MLVFKLMQLPLIDKAIPANDSDVRECSTDDEADEGKPLRSQVETVDCCKRPRASHHEDIKESELKRRIQTDEAHDWLREKHVDRPDDCLPNKILRDLADGSLWFGIKNKSSTFCDAFLKRLSVCFPYEYYREQKRHDEEDDRPLRPTPSFLLSEEAPNQWPI